MIDRIFWMILDDFGEKISACRFAGHVTTCFSSLLQIFAGHEDYLTPEKQKKKTQIERRWDEFDAHMVRGDYLLRSPQGPPQPEEQFPCTPPCRNSSLPWISVGSVFFLIQLESIRYNI